MARRTRRWTVEMTEAAPQIAEAILPMVRQYPEYPPGLQFHYETVLDRMARDLENFIRPRASVAALKKAEAMGLPDIRQFHWTQQEGRMRDPGREIFHWEHVVPCADSDEAGRIFQGEAGHLFRFHSRQRSDLKPDTLLV